MTPPKIPSYILAAALLSAGSVYASDNPEAHQHGQAELQFAIEGSQIDLIFTSPSYNLLGFEHRARTEEQKALVTETTEWFGETPLVNTTGAGCTVMNAVVHHQAGGDDQAHGHAHDHKDESSHSDFEVTQTLTCSNLNTAETLSTPLTAHFPEIQHLNVEWVWPGGQGSGRLDHGETRFRLRAQ